MTIAITIGGVNRTLIAPYDQLTIEAGVSSIARANLTLYDATCSISVADRAIVTIDVDGTRTFWGEVVTRAFGLFPGPGRWITLGCTDWNTLLDTRLVGCPTGDGWSGPDEQGNYVPVDGGAISAGDDALTVTALFANYVRLPSGAALDASTYVTAYITGSYLGSHILYWDRTTLRGALDAVAGICANYVSANAPVAFWIDAGTTSTPPAVHWQSLPSPDSSAVLPTSSIGFSETPNNSTTFAVEDLKVSYDGTGMIAEIYETGAVGFAWDGGTVALGGSGWYGGPTKEARQALLGTDARTPAEHDAYAAKVLSRSSSSLLRGTLTYTDLSASLIFFPGNSILVHYPTATGVDASYPIQKVTTKFLSGDAKRQFTIEWGDAPTPRFTQRPAAVVSTPPKPGLEHQIAAPFDSPPKPLGTATYSGQFANQNGEGWPVADLTVKFTVLDWDASGTPISPAVSTVSPTSTTTDKDGRWSTVVTYGATTYFCQVVAESPAV